MSTTSAQDTAADKKARLEARVTLEQKALFQKAAAILGRSLTDFVVSSAHELAMRTIHEHEVMTLTARDQEVFVASLLKAPEPGTRLQAAARHYRKTARR